LEVDSVITIEGTKWVPPPKLKVIASPAATSPMRTPVAPACAARSILRLMAHTPRSISAILPAGLVIYGSSTATPDPAGHPRPTYATSPVTPALTGAKSSVAVFAYVPAMLLGELMTSGITVAVGTLVWATLMTPSPIDGELTMYGRLPALPAAATTTTPYFTAVA